MEPLTLCAVGDVRIDHKKANRPTPESAFDLCRHVFEAADINFFNCEGVYTDRVVTVASQHTAVSSPPVNFAALPDAGFHVASLANNHSADKGTEGLLDTIELCETNGITVSGAGRTLAEARRPAIVEKRGTKVAFLSYNSVGPVEGAARPDRPGDVPLRVATVYQAMEYQPGTPCKIMTFADPADLAAMRDDIAAAREQADVVVVHVHWGLHHVQALIHMYQQQIAHAAVDAGADLVLGEHDHVVKGIEVYKGRAIFYGLGDFIVDHSTATAHTAWRKMKMVLYDMKYDLDYPTYPFAAEARHHLIVKCAIEDGRITRVSYLPCTINTKGQPLVLSADDERFKTVADYFESISRHQGLSVTLTAAGDEIVVTEGSAPTRPSEPVLTKFIIAPLDSA
jgi:poly-gamma-glutamate capsule biosynthesis protein CapA/YwtB (metallophosphatase superfamily)